MEHYRTTFLPPSSSNHSFGQIMFPRSTVQAPPLDELRGEPEIGGFASSKGKEETASLGSTHLPMETEATSDSDDEKKPAKKKSEKKVQRPKYAFQTRTQVDILDDGYRWRKYGQKAVKNSRFPRSYYRCTHQGCSVKKQVQRLSKDEGVVVTTYEGKHTHPIEKLNDNFEQILGQMMIFTNTKILE